MLDVNDILYDISRQDKEVSVAINLRNNVRGGCKFACYLLRDGSIDEKKMYQQSNCFTFSISENGLYYFALFVKENDNEKCDPVIKYTEKFEIKNYKLALFADEEVESVCTLINEITWCKYKDIDAKINEDVILADIIYLINIFSEDKNDDEAVNSIYLALKRCKEQNKKIILLIRYISEYSRSHIVQEVIKETLNLQVDFIDCHQILHYGADGSIIYEEYHRYYNALKNRIFRLLDNYDRDICAAGNRVDISIQKNRLDISFVAESCNENIKYNYYILKDGQVYYKHDKWVNENQFSYILSENGIYMVQGYIKCNGNIKILKSHTVEYFSEDYRKEFGTFCTNKILEQKDRLDFFSLSEPWKDFAVIQSYHAIDSIQINDNLKLHKVDILGSKFNYILSTEPPKERYGKSWICSGMIYADGQILYGNEMLNNVFTLCDNKLTGVYSMAEIDKRSIRVSNDFFNLNRLFYYSSENLVVCTNRYHLLLLVLKELNVKIKLDENKALMTLSNIRIPYLTQNTCNSMDMAGIYKCSNSYDIIINEDGLSFELNEYGKILKSQKIVNEYEYREKIKHGCEEIINNVNSVIKSEKGKNVIVDLSGGMDSRVVFGAVLKADCEREILSVRSIDVPGSNDLEIAVKINNLYCVSWDTSKEVRKRYCVKYSDMMCRSFFMGLYYSHNMFNASVENQTTVRLTGACGEILLRPYSGRKYLNTELMHITDTEEYLDYLLRDWSDLIIVDYSAAKEFTEYMKKEFNNYGNCSLTEKLDRVYLEHRSGYHFEPTLSWQNGTYSFIPLQSKALFELHHSIYNVIPSIKQQLDVLNIIEPYLASFPFDSDMDNADKAALKDTLFYDDEYYRYIKADTLNNCYDEYRASVEQKKIWYLEDEACNEQTDLKQKMLDALGYICNCCKIIKEKAGVAIYYYIQTHNKEEDKKQLRYLYNKIMSLRDQLMIFDEGCKDI